jgi:hypothetical protein
MILVHHGGGEGGHYFMTEAAQVWCSDSTDHFTVSIQWGRFL